MQSIKQVLCDLLAQLTKAQTSADAWYYLLAIHSIVSNNPDLLEHLPDNVFRVLYEKEW